MRVLIIIPAYNEAENLPRVIPHLQQVCPDYDYIIVNDGSSDNTADLCRQNHYRFIDLPVNLGLAGAFQTGMKYACQHGYDYAIQFDADGQHRPEYIKDLLAAMDNCDIAIGSRFITEKKPRTLRMLGSNVISASIRLITGRRIKDPTSGMRMYNKAMIRELAYGLNLGPEPDTVSYLMKKANARVSEIQVTMDERIAGESYLTFTRSISYMIRMSLSILFIQNFRKKF